jgi:release factor glutamine methyltransferase
VIRSKLPRHEARRLWDVSDGDEVVFRSLEERRLSGEPLQYLEGTAPFGPLDLVVDRRVLIPRPETEQLWEMIARTVQAPAVVVDLCTGSGALAVACKATWPDARVVATDLSPDAVAVARLNAFRLGVDIEVHVGDLFDPLPDELRGRVDVLVSNPPYVAEGEWEELPVDVRAEPRMALVSGVRGTEILDEIASEAAGWVAPGGLVALEIGETQGAHVAGSLAADFEDVAVRPDLTGRDRFVLAHLPA